MLEEAARRVDGGEHALVRVARERARRRAKGPHEKRVKVLEACCQEGCAVTACGNEGGIRWGGMRLRKGHEVHGTEPCRLKGCRGAGGERLLRLVRERLQALALAGCEGRLESQGSGWLFVAESAHGVLAGGDLGEILGCEEVHGACRVGLRVVLGALKGRKFAAEIDCSR
jgi:hypothetical protein